MNIRVTTAAEGLDRRAFTVKDVLRMVESGVLGRDERFELIGGEIVPMSPKGLTHEMLRQWLNERLVKDLPDHAQTAAMTTFYLSDDTFIEPDFVVYPRDSGLQNLSPETCGLAIEVADSSLAYDLGRKARLYAEFGIGELWVFNVKASKVTVHRAPVDGVYQAISEHGFDQTLTPERAGGFSLDMTAFKPQ